jgi:A/G-specific adenine glycosylase
MSPPAEPAEASPAKALLAWYDRHKRELPWRRDTDAYRVWISEIMLQQTRVETALPYYDSFLERFPDVRALAGVPVEEVLALWSGLGYYRRARQVHAAARRIADAGFPTDAAGWRELPGIGEYTSAAIASIAFGEVVPVLDGNVERVTARLLALAEDPKRSAPRRLLRAAAAELLDPARPGDGNQALMELGARVCTPRNPKCLLCPLAEGCEGRRTGAPERFPRAKERKGPRRLVRTVALVETVETVQTGEAGARRLLFRRGDHEELLAGFWELPWTGVEGADGAGDADGEGAAETPEAATAALGQRYGGRWRIGERLATVRHGITTRAFELRVHRADVETGGELAEGPEARWASDEELAGLPTSSMVEKILAAVRE